MGLISSIKNDIKKSGQSKKKLLYVRSDEKVRIRFLTEIDDGSSFVFHDSFDKGINCLCRKELDEDADCPYCEMSSDEIRTRTLYAWSVYNYDKKEVEIAMFAVNQCTPVSQIIQLAENYGTITDRDYVLIKSGKQQSTSYSVIPQDKNKFRNDKAKPLSRSAMLKIIEAALPFDSDTEDDDDDDDRSSKKTKSKKSGKAEKEKKYRALDDDEMPIQGKNTKKDKKKKKAMADIEWMEEQLEDNDIDEDEFCEYFEVKSLKKIKDKTQDEFTDMVEEYLDDVDDDDDDDEDDDE